jgi:hypothetical protein
MSLILGILDSGGAAAGGGASYESISTVNVTSNTASVTLSSIPATYTHLQIRGILRSSYVPSNTSMRLTFNSDTGNNYTSHNLNGTGSGSVTAGDESGNPFIVFARAAYNGLTAGIFTSFVIDILDYANTNKNKTIRVLNGYDANGEGQVSLRSGAYLSTTAISSINLFSNVGDIMQYSQFALYGIKGS